MIFYYYQSSLSYLYDEETNANSQSLNWANMGWTILVALEVLLTLLEVTVEN